MTSELRAATRQPATTAAASDGTELKTRVDVSVEQAYEFFAQDPLLTAYPLCYLERAPATCRLTLTYRGEQPVAGLALTSNVYFDALFAFGEPAALSVAAPASPAPPSLFWASGKDEALRAIGSRFHCPNRMRFLRLAVDRQSFRSNGGTAVTLTASDYHEIARLYQFVPGTAFGPDQLEAGVYYGRFERGRLVSVAGTHGLSARHRLAIVGNVLTHPAHGRRGHSTACVSALVEELLRGHDQIVLNVAADNNSAIRIYQRLGFQLHHAFEEGQAATASRRR